MSPYSDIVYIYIDGNKCLCHYQRLLNLRRSANDNPRPRSLRRWHIITHETCRAQVQLFKFLLMAKLLILHCTKVCDVLAWFKYILVFTHVDVIHRNRLAVNDGHRHRHRASSTHRWPSHHQSIAGLRRSTLLLTAQKRYVCLTSAKNTIKYTEKIVHHTNLLAIWSLMSRPAWYMRCFDGLAFRSIHG